VISGENWKMTNEELAKSEERKSNRNDRLGIAALVLGFAGAIVTSLPFPLTDSSKAPEAYRKHEAAVKIIGNLREAKKGIEALPEFYKSEVDNNLVAGIDRTGSNLELLDYQWRNLPEFKDYTNYIKRTEENQKRYKIYSLTSLFSGIGIAIGFLANGIRHLRKRNKYLGIK
jgi:hypothetical protein